MFRKIVFSVMCFVVAVIVFEACAYNKADQEYPSSVNNTCDTINVRYSVEIKLILDANCKTCHDGAASVSGFDLYDYSIISSLALDGQFTYGTLLSAIMHKGGAPFMPEDAPMLDDCSINKIAAWIHNGAPNN